MRSSVFLVFALAICSCSRNHEPSRDTADDAKSTAPAAPGQPAPATSADDRKVLVVFGDSIAAGFGLPTGRSFPDYLQKKLDDGGYMWRVVNLGISGDTTEGGVSRIDSATSLNPSIVVLELGGNDGLRGMPLASTRANLDQMIVAFQNAGAKVVLAGMTLPPNYGPDYIHGFEKIYKDLAAERHVTLIPFLLADIVTKDLRYIQPDGIHPTAPGAEIIAGTVLRAVEPLMASQKRSGKASAKPTR
jgi:acyl-CoA thioesterase-1